MPSEDTTLTTARAPSPESGGLELFAAGNSPARRLRTMPDSGSTLPPLRSRAALLCALSARAAARFSASRGCRVPAPAASTPAARRSAGTIPQSPGQQFRAESDASHADTSRDRDDAFGHTSDGRWSKGPRRCSDSRSRALLAMRCSAFRLGPPRQAQAASYPAPSATPTSSAA